MTRDNSEKENNNKNLNGSALSWPCRMSTEPSEKEKENTNPGALQRKPVTTKLERITSKDLPTNLLGII